MLLERLAEERLGGDGARRAVLYLALFPTALFLQAVYSESLFLFLCLGAFVLAERGRIAWAGVVVGLALLTRPTAIALVPPLVLIARHAVRGASRRRCRSPPRIRCCSGGSSTTRGRSRSAEGTWHRHLSPAGPLGGIWDGLRAGWAGIEQLASGSNAHVYWTAVGPADSTPLRTAALNLLLLGFLVLFVALTVIAWREVRRALRPVRGAEPRAAAERPQLALAAALAAPLRPRDLPVLPRARVDRRPQPARARRDPRLQRLLLGVFVTQWALWDWVA